MNTIYKYPIEVNDYPIVRMPKGAKILAFQSQNGQLCLWAQIERSVEDVDVREFRLFATGHPFAELDNLVYIGTAQQPPFVWHLFEITEDKK